MMGLLLIFLACLAAPSLAGRAFPSASENYVVQLFQRVNPNIRWDETNYVVDLSGYHAQCEYAEMGGVSYESTRTRDGEIITVIQDSGEGEEAHVNAVNSYIPPILEDWPRLYASHIRKAEKFGCSVQPGCQGRLSVACLFSPSLQEPQEQTPPPGGSKTKVWSPNPMARAFTPEQYSLAEEITGTRWGRDHFLENLSAYDIECGTMLKDSNVRYEKATTIAGDRGKAVRGVYGYSENRGDTEQAMVAILKKMYKPPSSKLVGCSLIADCMKGTQMYVVSSCIYQV